MTYPQGYPPQDGQQPPAGQSFPPLPPLPGQQAAWRQPPPGPPGYGPPTGYGPPAGYGPPTGYGPGPGQPWGPGQPVMPKKKSHVGLIVTLVLVGVLVLCGGGGVGVWALTRDTKPKGSPIEAVQALLTAAFVNNDSSTVAKYTYSGKTSMVQAQIAKGKQPSPGVTAVPSWDRLTEKISGKTAAVTAGVTYKVTSGSSTGRPVGFWGFVLKVEDGEWKVYEWYG